MRQSLSGSLLVHRQGAAVRLVRPHDTLAQRCRHGALDGPVPLLVATGTGRKRRQRQRRRQRQAARGVRSDFVSCELQSARGIQLGTTAHRQANATRPYFGSTRREKSAQSNGGGVARTHVMEKLAAHANCRVTSDGCGAGCFCDTAAVRLASPQQSITYNSKRRAGTRVKHTRRRWCWCWCWFQQKDKELDHSAMGRRALPVVWPVRGKAVAAASPRARRAARTRGSSSWI